MNTNRRYFEFNSDVEYTFYKRFINVIITLVQINQHSYYKNYLHAGHIK